MKTISIKNLSGLSLAAKTILDFAKTKPPPSGKKAGCRIFCFYGELGSGKTTLIKEICTQLGVTDAGSSPTFSLVNEYKTSLLSSFTEGMKKEVPLYHFDLYRLKSESEIYDIGYEEYLFSGNYCFIEWPEKMESLLPKEVVKVRIETKGEERIMHIS